MLWVLDINGFRKQEPFLSTRSQIFELIAGSDQIVCMEEMARIEPEKRASAA